MIGLSGAGPEVAQFHRALIAEQEVLNLEVAVNDGRGLAVHVLYRLCSLIKGLQHHVTRKGAAP